MNNNEEIVEVKEQIELVLKERPIFTKIVCRADAEDVSAFLGKIKILLKKMDGYFDDNIKKAHDLHKSLVAQKKEAIARPIEVENCCKRLLTDWQLTEQERIRLAQEEADRKAQEEANRIAREEALKAAKEAGDKKKAEGIKKGKIEVVAEQVASVAVEEAPKIAGVSLRELYCAEVTSLQELCKAVGAGKAPLEYVMANMPSLNKVAQATKGQVMVPGVKMVKKHITAAR